jgi:D-glycero-alpha-D-manno-heptose-7-phosphate kinase
VAIVASAPVRICDIGGWTDTWFGAPGRVFNVAVSPGVEVTVRAVDGTDPVVLEVPAFADRYSIVPGGPRTPRHQLIEAAVDAFAPRGGRPVEIAVRSAVPPGCGTGTSAAVAVAMVGALAALRDEPLSPRQAAREAHRLEVGILGAESGVQDQLSSALGGINFIEVDAYPEATVHRLAHWDDLDRHLTLVYLGGAHDSSSLHQRVIERTGSNGDGCFAHLRDAAVAAREAAASGDLRALGGAMIAATEAQRTLLSELVGEAAQRVIDLARTHGALGWKVNGAGGPGGSVALLSATPTEAEALVQRVRAEGAPLEVLPIRLSPVGLAVAGAI